MVEWNSVLFKRQAYFWEKSSKLLHSFLLFFVVFSAILEKIMWHATLRFVYMYAFTIESCHSIGTLRELLIWAFRVLSFSPYRDLNRFLLEMWNVFLYCSESIEVRKAALRVLRTLRSHFRTLYCVMLELRLVWSCDRQAYGWQNLALTLCLSQFFAITKGHSKLKIEGRKGKEAKEVTWEGRFKKRWAKNRKSAPLGNSTVTAASVRAIIARVVSVRRCWVFIDVASKGGHKVTSKRLMPARGIHM